MNFGSRGVTSTATFSRPSGTGFNKVPEGPPDHRRGKKHGGGEFRFVQNLTISVFVEKLRRDKSATGFAVGATGISGVLTLGLDSDKVSSFR